MPDTDTLLKDVKTHAEGDATLLAALGSLYFDATPPVDAYPYWFVSLYRPTKQDNAFGTRYIDEHNVEFHIYGTAMSTLSGYQDTLHARFDRATITMTSGGGVFLACERQFSHKRRTATMRDKNGAPIYQSISRYQIKVDKGR